MSTLWSFFFTTMASSIALDKLNASVAECGKPWISGKCACAQLKSTAAGKPTTFFRACTMVPFDARAIVEGDPAGWHACMRVPVGKLAAEQLGLAMDQAVACLQGSDNAEADCLAAAEGRCGG